MKLIFKLSILDYLWAKKVVLKILKCYRDGGIISMGELKIKVFYREQALSKTQQYLGMSSKGNFRINKS